MSAVQTGRLRVPQGEPFFWVTDAGAANAGNEPANHPAAANAFAFGGLAGDVFVTGDWTGGGKTTAGVYRAGFWVLDAAVPGAPQAQHVPGLTSWYGGVAGDVPVPAKWPTYTKPGSLTLTSTSSNTDSATFNATWIDPSGNATNISQVQIAFAAPVSMDYVTTVNGCGIQYYPPPNYTAANAGNGTLYLGSATGDNQFPYSSAIGPTGQTLSNGVCVIDAANTLFSVSGATVILNMPVMFINAVTTSYSMFTSATNSNGFDNWVNFGQWTAPAVSLISKSVTANGGSSGGTGDAINLTAIFTDTAGVGDMNSVQIVLTPNNTGVLNSQSLSTANGCHLIFAVPSGPLSLESAAGNGTYSSSPIGSQGQVLSNGVCVVDAAQFVPTLSSSPPGGLVNTLAVNVPIDLISATQSQYWAYSSVTSNVGAKNNGWTRFWHWLQSLSGPPVQCATISPEVVDNFGPCCSHSPPFNVIAINAKFVDLMVQSANQPVASSQAFRTTRVGDSNYEYTFSANWVAAMPPGAYKIIPRLNGSKYCPAAFYGLVNKNLAPSSVWF